MRNSRSLLWLLAGAAAGAAAVYILTRDDRDEMLDDIKDFARRTKDTIAERLSRLQNMAGSEDDMYNAEGTETSYDSGPGRGAGYGTGNTL